MTAVRKAKYRFSTLRSRVTHRSASGSQVGDAMQAAHEPSSLSVQLSGQCISPRPCLAIPCQHWCIRPWHCGCMVVHSF